VGVPGRRRCWVSGFLRSKKHSNSPLLYNLLEQCITPISVVASIAQNRKLIRHSSRHAGRATTLTGHWMGLGAMTPICWGHSGFRYVAPAYFKPGQLLASAGIGQRAGCTARCVRNVLAIVKLAASSGFAFASPRPREALTKRASWNDQSGCERQRFARPRQRDPTWTWSAAPAGWKSLSGRRGPRSGVSEWLGRVRIGAY
jgi:hypothetical protein